MPAQEREKHMYEDFTEPDTVSASKWTVAGASTGSQNVTLLGAHDPSLLEVIMQCSVSTQASVTEFLPAGFAALKDYSVVSRGVELNDGSIVVFSSFVPAQKQPSSRPKQRHLRLVD